MGPQYDVYKTIEYNGKFVGFTHYLDLLLTDCNGQDEQKWAFKRDGRIRNKLLDNYGFDACVLADNFIFPKLRLCDADDDEYFQFSLQTDSTCYSRLLVDDCNDHTLVIPGWTTSGGFLDY